MTTKTTRHFVNEPRSTKEILEASIISLIRLTGACRVKGISKSQVEDGIQGVIKNLEEIKARI